MKSISRAGALATSTLFATLLAGCSSMQSGSGSSGTGASAEGGTGSGMSTTSSECAQFHQMESRRTPSTQQELVDPNLQRMSPEERERHMAMMREKCGPSASSPPSRY